MSKAQDGGKVVSLTHRSVFTPRKYAWYSFLLEAESTPGPQCDRKYFMPMKNSNDTNWDRTSDLPICSTAPALDITYVTWLNEYCTVRTILTFWSRNYFLNFSTFCIQNVNNIGTKYVRIMKQTAFWRGKNGEYKPCLKYSVPIFVE